MMELEVELIYFVAWVVAGAYAVSLGTTASFRVTEIGKGDDDAGQESTLVGDTIFHAVGRMVMVVLRRSTCDGNKCDWVLRIPATIPLLGAFVQCLNPKCEYSRGVRWKYLFSEFSGGISVAVLWLALGLNMHSMLPILLVPFLVSFLVSMKNGIYRDIDLAQSKPSAVRMRLAQQHGLLTVGIGLTAIGWMLPIETNYQYLGMALLGLFGWLAGTWCAKHEPPTSTNRPYIRSCTPIRCFVSGLVVGAWFGIAMGTLVSILIVVFMFLRGLILEKYCARYVEECMLVIGFGAILVIAATIYSCFGMEYWEIVGITEVNFENKSRILQCIFEAMDEWL